MMLMNMSQWAAVDKFIEASNITNHAEKTATDRSSTSVAGTSTGLVFNSILQVEEDVEVEKKEQQRHYKGVDQRALRQQRGEEGRHTRAAQTHATEEEQLQNLMKTQLTAKLNRVIRN